MSPWQCPATGGTAPSTTEGCGGPIGEWVLAGGWVLTEGCGGPIGEWVLSGS